MKKFTNKILISLVSSIVIIAIGLAIVTAKINKNLFNPHSSQVDVSHQLANYSNFDSVSIKGAGKIIITQGAFKLSMSVTPNAHPAIFQINNLLELSSIDSGSTVIIQMPELKAITTAGAANVSISGFANKSTLAPSHNSLIIDLTGSSALTVTNASFSNISLSASGASAVDFESCNLVAMTVKASGATNLNLNSFSNGILNGSVSGITNIKYSGTVLKNKLKTSGVVSISPNNQAN